VGYTAGFVDVYMNGVRLVDGTDFTATNGSDIVLTTGAAAGDTIEVVAYSTYEVNSQNYTGGLTVDNDGATVLTVDRATSDGTIIDVQKDGASVGSIGAQSGKLQINGSSGTGFFLDTVQILPKVNGALADNQADLGSSAYRYNELWLGGGVYLGGTGAANKLDDYEEGTWTPTLNNGSFNGTTTARYTKIGNKVTVWVYASSMSDTTTTSSLLIGGLPFSSVAAGTMDSVAGAVMLRYLDVGITEEMGVVCFVAGGSTDMRLYVLNTGTTYVAVQNSHFNNANIGLRATLTYETS
jgi:hypothetical protein